MGLVNMIKKDANYIAVMARIDGLMAKGSGNVSKEELAGIRSLALSAQAYEQGKYAIEPPETLVGMIDTRMYE